MHLRDLQHGIVEFLLWHYRLDALKRGLLRDEQLLDDYPDDPEVKRASRLTLRAWYERFPHFGLDISCRVLKAADVRRLSCANPDALERATLVRNFAMYLRRRGGRPALRVLCPSSAGNGTPVAALPVLTNLRVFTACPGTYITVDSPRGWTVNIQPLMRAIEVFDRDVPRSEWCQMEDYR